MESVRNASPTGAIWTLEVGQLLFGPWVCQLPTWREEETMQRYDNSSSHFCLSTKHSKPLINRDSELLTLVNNNEDSQCLSNLFVKIVKYPQRIA